MPASAPTSTSRSFGDRVSGAVAWRLDGLRERLEDRSIRRKLRLLGVQTKGIRTWMTRRELNRLFRLALDCPPNLGAVEVGSYLGASANYIAAGVASRGGRLTCVDTWNNDEVPEDQRDTMPEFEKNTADVRRWVSTRRKRSDELIDADVPASLSMVFLDGDHGYEAVHWEFRFFGPRIVQDGYLAFHDSIVWPGVARVIGEALASGEWQFGGHIDNLIWLKKVEWKELEYLPSVAI